MGFKGSASHVHLIAWGSLKTWLFVQFLDGLSMKYTELVFCLAMPMVAQVAPAPAQTSYVASTSELAVTWPGLDSTQPGSLITIHTRGNARNVLVIPMDKDGRFFT